MALCKIPKRIAIRLIQSKHPRSFFASLTTCANTFRFSKWNASDYRLHHELNASVALCSGPCSVLKKQRCLKRLRVTEHGHDQNHSEILSVLSSCPHLWRCLVVSVSWG